MQSSQRNQYSTKRAQYKQAKNTPKQQGFVDAYRFHIPQNFMSEAYLDGWRLGQQQKELEKMLGPRYA